MPYLDQDSIDVLKRKYKELFNHLTGEGYNKKTANKIIYNYFNDNYKLTPAQIKALIIN